MDQFRVDEWCKVGRDKYHLCNNQLITTVCEKTLPHCTSTSGAKIPEQASQIVWALPSEILCGSGCCAVEWTVDWNPGGGFCVVGQPAESKNQPVIQITTCIFYHTTL